MTDGWVIMSAHKDRSTISLIVLQCFELGGEKKKRKALKIK